MNSSENTGLALTMMKRYKLKVHAENFSEELIVFNSSDFPDFKSNDLLKIYHCDGSPLNFLLVQVKSLKGELPKDTISIKKKLADCFNLQVFQDVYVFKVHPEDVTIDLLEVSFKDQYISRSDMLRMKRNFTNSCVYIDQNVEFSGIRAQASEMWANSMKTECGFITDSTNFVLRSFTAKVYLFIQMSAEMWEYDAYGYLQFERAVNGFLKALFTKWKEKKCCHDLTLVLFSRKLFETKNVEDFPPNVRDVVRKNYRGQLYLDFYKCVVQSERMDDCTPLIKVLKKLFHKYESLTEVPGCPPGKNSISSEGNFLEAINMSLNVFERHHTDRNLDRTGQIVICITPGAGVFDADRDLTILTKERMIDNGIGSDLICLGQQPLHAVPLFKFHHSTNDRDGTEALFCSNESTKVQIQDFNIPHWINHSFYTSNPFTDRGTTNINYISRIHVPKRKTKKAEPRSPARFGGKSTIVKPEIDTELPVLQQTNYADFDKQVFGFQRYSNSWKQLVGDISWSQKAGPQQQSIRRRSQRANDDWNISQQSQSPDDNMLRQPPSRPMFIPHRNNRQFAQLQQGLASSVGMTNNLEKYYVKREHPTTVAQPVVGSATISQSRWKGSFGNRTQRRALFNPFNPSHMYAPLTANRRRWVHTYPRGPQGEALVLHHQNPYTRSISRSRQVSESTEEDYCASTVPFSGTGASPTSPPNASPSTSVNYQRQFTLKSDSNESFGECCSSPQANKNVKHLPGNESITWSLNPNPAEHLSRRLDWKSLKFPACLPITTDYCPSKSHLEHSYTEHTYFLVPDDVYVDSTAYSDDQEKSRADSSPADSEFRGTREIFQELINQRLCQGFQIIKHSSRTRNNDSNSSNTTLISPSASEGSFISFMCGTSPILRSPTQGYAELRTTNSDLCMLSHGRQYHTVRFIHDEDKIEVKIYKPRHPFMTATVGYSYLLWPKTRGQFQPSRCGFAHEKMEDYNWNHHDDYVCYPDGHLQHAAHSSNFKYWQAKFVVLANPTKRLQALKRTNGEGPMHYDVFDRCSCEKSTEPDMEGVECAVMTEGFVRFLENLNKIKRPHAQATKLSSKLHNSCSPTASKSYQSQLFTYGQSASYVSNHHTPTPPARPTSTPLSGQSTPVRNQLTESMSVGPPSAISTKLSHAVNAKPVPVRAPTQPGEGVTCDFRHTHLSSNSEMTDIVAAMKDKETGLCFLPEECGLHCHAFVALEAVHWALTHIDDLKSIKDACKLIETMCKYGWIVHASGSVTRPFIYGYLFYYIVDSPQAHEIEDPTSYQYSTAPSTEYQNRWFEVAIERDDLIKEETNNRSLFGSDGNFLTAKSSAFYRTSPRDSPRSSDFPDTQIVRIPMMNKMRTNRTEWAQVPYTTHTRLGANTLIFSFEMQWMVATATCIFDKLQMWSRKAWNCDLHLFPVPSDPFAFPESGTNGPLQSPLFVTLDVRALMRSSTKFKDFSRRIDVYRDTIITFMNSILLRFGFIRDDWNSYNADSKSSKSTPHNFVHCTGQVFAQIPLEDRTLHRHSISLKRRPQSVKHSLPTANKLKPPSNDDSSSFAIITQAELDSTGFYWSTNYMLTKRWRVASLDDCPLQDLEQDFVKFCSNVDQRLEKYFATFIEDFSI